MELDEVSYRYIEFCLRSLIMRYSILPKKNNPPPHFCSQKMEGFFFLFVYVCCTSNQLSLFLLTTPSVVV